MRGLPSMSLKFLMKYVHSYTKFCSITPRPSHNCTNTYQSIIRTSSVSEVVELTTQHDHHSFYCTVCSIQRNCMLHARSSSLLKYCLLHLTARAKFAIGGGGEGGDRRGAYSVLMWKSEAKRPLGRCRRTWEDVIKMDLQVVAWGFMDWIDLAQDRDRWRALMNAGSIKLGEFLD